MRKGLNNNNFWSCSINEKKLKNHKVCLFREYESQEMAKSSQESQEVLKMSSLVSEGIWLKWQHDAIHVPKCHFNLPFVSELL